MRSRASSSDADEVSSDALGRGPSSTRSRPSASSRDGIASADKNEEARIVMMRAGPFALQGTEKLVKHLDVDASCRSRGHNDDAARDELV